MSPTGAFYLDTYSSLRPPSGITLHSGDGKEFGVYREADRTQALQYDILPTEIVKFKGRDGANSTAGLSSPRGSVGGKYR